LIQNKKRLNAASILFPSDCFLLDAIDAHPITSSGLLLADLILA
jgi:hypothetical protein